MSASCSGNGGPQTRWSRSLIIAATGIRSMRQGGTASHSMGISTAALVGVTATTMSRCSSVALMSLCCLVGRPRSPHQPQHQFRLPPRRHRRRLPRRRPRFRPLSPHQSQLRSPHRCRLRHRPSVALVKEGRAVPPALTVGGAARANPIAWHALGAGAVALIRCLQHQHPW